MNIERLAVRVQHALAAGWHWQRGLRGGGRGEEAAASNKALPGTAQYRFAATRRAIPSQIPSVPVHRGLARWPRYTRTLPKAFCQLTP